MRDAHNLAWKLAAVLSGHFGDALLDTYEAERKGHVAEMTHLAIRMGQVMMPRSRMQAIALQSFFRALALYPSARSYFAEMKYKPKPRFRRGFLLAPKSSVKESLVGKLFPQAIVMTTVGFALLDDVLGDGFALLAPPGTPPRTLADVRLAATSKLPMRAVAVLDKEDTSAVETPIAVARDLRGELAQLLWVNRQASTSCVRTGTWPRFSPFKTFSLHRVQSRSLSARRGRRLLRDLWHDQVKELK